MIPRKRTETLETSEVLVTTLVARKKASTTSIVPLNKAYHRGIINQSASGTLAHYIMHRNYWYCWIGYSI